VDRRLFELRPTPIARVRPGELVKVIGTIRARAAPFTAPPSASRSHSKGRS
jgi:hypothetical protein